MSEEDKEILEKYIELIKKDYCSDCNELNCIDNFPHKKIAQAIETVLAELEEYKIACSCGKENTNTLRETIKILQKELEKKDKIIDLMTEELYEHRYQNNLNFFKDAKKARGITTSIKDIKQYFKEIAEEN